MGKICAVPNCHSGHRPHEKQRRLEGVRPTAFFCVPKNLDTRKKWSQELNMHLGDKNFICELHFAPQQIISEDTTVLPDGSVHSIPRSRSKLALDAIPFLIQNQECVDRTLVNNLEQEEIDVPNQDVDVEQHSTTSYSDLQLQTNGNMHNTKIAQGTVMDVQQPEKRAKKFTIEDIVDYFQHTPLRQAWCWAENMHGSRHIILMHTNSWTYKIRLILKIHNNLTVTAHSSDNKVMVQLRESITSAQKILQLLDKFENEFIECNGTGFADKSRAHGCSGFISSNHYQRYVNIPRCEVCMRLRRNLARRTTLNHRAYYPRASVATNMKQRRVDRLIKKINRKNAEKYISRRRQ